MATRSLLFHLFALVACAVRFASSSPILPRLAGTATTTISSTLIDGIANIGPIVTAPLATPLFTLALPASQSLWNATWPTRSEACAVVSQDTLIVAGGSSNLFSDYDNDVYQFHDVATGWSSNVATTPFTPRYGHRCIEYQSIIYLLGGVTSDSDVTDDIFTSADLGVTWVQLPALPLPTSYPGLLQYQSQLWMMGSRDTNLEVEIWTNANPFSDDWVRTFFSSVAPSQRLEPAFELLGDMMYLVGGLVSGVGQNDVWSFDPSTSVWASLDPLPSGSANLYASHTIFSNSMVLIGGLDSTQSVESDTMLTFDGTTWNRFSRSPLFGVSAPMVLNFRGTLFVMGGDSFLTTTYNEVYVSNEIYSRTGPLTTPSSTGTTVVDSSTGTTTTVESSTGTTVVVTPSSTGGSVSPPPVTSSTGTNLPVGSTSSSSGAGTGVNAIAASSSSSSSLLLVYIIVPIVVVLLICCGGYYCYRPHQGDKGHDPDVESGRAFMGVAGPARNGNGVLVGHQQLAASNQQPLPGQERQRILVPAQRSAQYDATGVIQQPQEPFSQQQPQYPAAGAALLVPLACAPHREKEASPQYLAPPGQQQKHQHQQPQYPQQQQLQQQQQQQQQGLSPDASPGAQVRRSPGAKSRRANKSASPVPPAARVASPLPPNRFVYDVTLMPSAALTDDEAAASRPSASPAGVAAVGGLGVAGAALAVASGSSRSGRGQSKSPAETGGDDGVLTQYTYDVDAPVEDDQEEKYNSAAMTANGAANDRSDDSVPLPFIYRYDSDDNLSSTRSLRTHSNHSGHSQVESSQVDSVSIASTTASAHHTPNSSMAGLDFSRLSRGVSNASSNGDMVGAGVLLPITPDPSHSNPLTTPGGSKRLLSTASFGRVLRSFDIGREEVVLRRPVGRGGFGTVWLAEYRGVDAAVKIIDVAGAGDIMAAFERELAVMCSVHNNRLIQVYGACRDPKQPFIVMEWMENGSLFDCLHGSPGGKHAPLSTSVLTPQLKLQIAIQLLEGVTYMHSCQPPMLHTDIKSHNVLLDQSFNAKTADFGFAQILAQTNSSSLMSIRGTIHNSLTMSGKSGGKQSASSLSCGGTLAYLPPESLGEELVPADTSLDMYATGVVLWELFSGLVPWQGLTFTQIICQVGLYKKSLPMKAQIPPVIQPILKQLFQERKKRPPARDVLRQLRAINPDALRGGHGHLGVAAEASIESTYC